MCDMIDYCGRLKKEFRKKNFWLQYNHPQMCVQFQFGYQHLYLIWRTFWALYHVSWIITSGVRADIWAGSDGNQYKKWFIYLTHWSYTILTLSTLVDAIVVLYVFAKRPDIRLGSTDSMPWYMKTNWCLFNVANSLSVPVAIAFWTFLYKRDKLPTSLDISFHLINALYVIANVCVTGMPMRILHFWFSVFVPIVYSLFTYIYYEAGGTNHHDSPYIYFILDWKNPVSAFGYCVALTLGVSIAHVFLYLIHSLKVCLVEKYQRRREYTAFGDQSGRLSHGVESPGDGISLNKLAPRS